MQPEKMQAELDKIVSALGGFLCAREPVVRKGSGERMLNHRLAVHVEKQFDGWDVDCDYNRLGERTLRLPRGTIISTDEAMVNRFFPTLSCTTAPFRKT